MCSWCARSLFAVCCLCVGPLVVLSLVCACVIRIVFQECVRSVFVVVFIICVCSVFVVCSLSCA